MTLSEEAGRVATAALKLAGTWGATAWAVVTMHNIAIVLAATLSGLQIYVLVRDQILARRGRK